VSNDCCSHDSDRSSASNQHVLTQYRERKRSVHRIAERIENGGHIAIHAAVVHPNVGHWQNQVFRKSARAIHPDTFRVGAQMSPACQAVSAMAAYDMAFAADDLAGEKISYIRADLDNFAYEFMANNHRHGNGFAGPIVPVVNVKISPADARTIDTDEHVGRSDSRGW